MLQRNFFAIVAYESPLQRPLCPDAAVPFRRLLPHCGGGVQTVQSHISGVKKVLLLFFDPSSPDLTGEDGNGRTRDKVGPSGGDEGGTASVGTQAAAPLPVLGQRCGPALRGGSPWGNPSPCRAAAQAAEPGADATAGAGARDPRWPGLEPCATTATTTCPKAVPSSFTRAASTMHGILRSARQRSRRLWLNDDRFTQTALRAAWKDRPFVKPWELHRVAGLLSELGFAVEVNDPLRAANGGGVGVAPRRRIAAVGRSAAPRA
jgi:hypothetical protein